MKNFYSYNLFFSIIFLLELSSISIKSTTIRPPKSLNLICLAISFAASKLVFNAVSFISKHLFDFPELTSIEIKASV